jgi:uncharacterized protein with ParB-like and HNH nuclease domain
MKSYDRNFYDLLTQVGQTYVIPSFQRNYSWDIRQWEDLWNDIYFLVKNPSKYHYTGSLVYIPSKEHNVFWREVIDGQQRLTTVSLTYLALHDLLRDKKLSDYSPENLRLQVLENPESSVDKSRLKLKPAGSDGEVYKKIFDNKVDELTSVQKQTNIFRCYRYFLEKLEEANIPVVDLINAAQRLQVIEIVLNQDDDHPQKVFESINSTGKKLTVDDLIRNYILMRGSHEEREKFYVNYWVKIEARLSKDNENLLEEFFTIFIKMQSQKDVTKSALYETFKNIYDKESNPQAFLDEVLVLAGVYEYIKFGRGIYSDELKRYRYYFDVLNYLKIDVFNIFTFSILRDYLKKSLSSEDTEEILNFIINYLSRRILAGKTTTSLNKYIPGLYARLNRYRIDTLGDILIHEFAVNVPAAIAYPSDNEVKQGIQTQDFYSRRKDNCRYVLLSIDNANRDNKHKNLLYDGSLSIEHVMPQTLSRSWQKSLGSDYLTIYDQYINKLANLTLTAYNSEYSNKPFVDKLHTKEKNGLAESPLLINQFFKNIKEWNVLSLGKREDILTESLLRVFPSIKPKHDYHDQLEKDFIQVDHILDTSNRTPQAFMLYETLHAVDSWAGMYVDFFESLDDTYDPEEIFKIMNELSTGKALMTRDETELRRPGRLDSGYFIECNKSSKDILGILTRFISVANEIEFKDVKIKLSS